MTIRIVILGGGTGGTLVANRLRRDLARRDAEIVVIDQDDHHLYQPGLLFVPFGLARVDELTRSRRAQLHDGISFQEAGIEFVDLPTDTVRLTDDTAVGYDVLVVATGAVLQPEETEGLIEALAGGGSSDAAGDEGDWPERVHTFYSPEGATRLAAALERFEGGKLVVNVVDLPVKCPVAPLEFCFLADWYFTERGIRDRVDLSYVTPLDGAFTKPVASKALAGLLGEKGVDLVTEFNTGAVDAASSQLLAYDDRKVEFDLAVVIPLHGGAPFVGRSPGLGDELGWVPVDPRTLQSHAKANVFAIGDATGVPASKAGSVTHFEGDVVAENVRRFLDGEPLREGFDGHTNCFIETGFHKALLIDFNYDTEPLPGHYPGAVGLPLLKETRLNHLGKLMFQWLYWHVLLPGRSIPGIGSAMPEHGKHMDVRP